MAPAGLLTDLDGTLAPIVRDPVSARVLPEAVDALRALARRLAVVAVITGRAALDARRMLGEAGGVSLIVGNHGLEWLEPGTERPAEDPALDEIREAIAAALGDVPRLPGVTVEDKGMSATVHYRRAADPTQARESVLTALRPVADAPSLTLREGRMSVELRPVAAGDKGTAARAIAARYRLRGLLVAGDDVTDLDMFRAARALAADDGIRTAILAVRGGREVAEEVTAAADAVVESPEECARLLSRLAER